MCRGFGVHDHTRDRQPQPQKATLHPPAKIGRHQRPSPSIETPQQLLGSVDLATGEPGQALVERSDVQAVEALAVVAEAAVAWELARAAREKFGGDALTDFVAAHVAYLERIRWPR